jgi:integrase
MGEVNFYLKKSEVKTGKSLIVLHKQYSGKRLVFSTGQTIDPNAWNPKKQRVKNNSLTTSSGTQYLNDYLNGLQNECDVAYNKALKDGTPAPELLRHHLKNFINNVSNDEKSNNDKATLFQLIDRFINNEIKHQGRDKAINTLKIYKGCKNHLLAFEQEENLKREKAKQGKIKVDFDYINLNFYYSFVSYLKSKGLGPNAIGKYIQTVKVFMAEAVDMELTSNLAFRHRKFAVTRAETDAVYLSEKELISLYQHDFTDNKKLEQVRDLFIFGCFVGLRFSDYSTVKPENIVKIGGENFIKQVTTKTKELVYIPFNPIVTEIFRKYDNSPNKLPKTISNQKFNDYIKEACKAAGLTEKARLSTDPNLELWECVSSHTARRSFATNLYLEGFPTIDIMKITGHKTEKAFMSYIRVNKLDAAKRLNDHNKRKNWSEILMKVVA